MTPRTRKAVCLTVFFFLSTSCGDAFAPAQAVVTVFPKSQATIVGGQSIDASYFPATGALLVRQSQASTTYEHVCTATLVDADLLLTAAHCQSSELSKQDCAETAPACYLFCQQAVLPPFVQKGEADKFVCSPAHDFIPHPHYKLPDLASRGLQDDVFDLALLRLKKPLTKITPAQLGFFLASPSETEVHLVGYGYDADPWQGFDATSPARKSYAISQLAKVGRREMHIGAHPEAPHKSFGDSGGPTFIQTPHGMRLVGITSRLYDLWDPDAGNIDSLLDPTDPWLQDFGLGLKPM